MKLIKISISLFITIIFFSSCTDIIELDLKNTEPRIIIEANLNTTDSTFSAKLTMSNNFYEDAKLKNVTGATITLENSDGTKYTIPEIENGYYFLNNISTKPNNIFSVKVIDANGKEYKANTTVPFPAEITLLLPAPFTPPGGGPNNNDTTKYYQITTLWKDTININNYYRIKTFINDEFQADDYAITDDRYNDGDTLASVSMVELYSKDKFKLQLLSTDQKYFKYFLDVAILYNKGPGTTTPYNPKGNFDNNALGYFGIYSVSEVEFTLP